MQPVIFDTHTHYTSGSFNKDRETLLNTLPTEGVALVVDCGTDLESSEKSLALAHKYEYLYTAAGIHPESIIEDDASTQTRFKGDWRAEIKAMLPLYEAPKVVAVGECGLDHHWPVPEQAQLALFEEEIRLALELEKPIIIHDREAHAEVYALLKKYRPKGVLHSYSGSVEDAAWLAKQGLYFGFGGVVTFKNARRPLEAAASVPEEQLVFETDCPYMAPEPFRGKRCNSIMIRWTAARVAAARGVEPDYLLEKTLENGKRLFGIE